MFRAVPTVVWLSVRASAMASQAAPSIRATMQGVAYTSRSPEPTSLAVSSRSARVMASPFMPTVISISITFLSYLYYTRKEETCQ